MPTSTPTTLTAEGQAALEAFRAKYPDFPTETVKWPSYIQKHPEAVQDWAQLQIAAKPPQGYRVDPASGGLVHNSTLKKFLASAALLVGSVATAGTLAAVAGGTAGLAAPAAGGVGIGETGATVGLGSLGAGGTAAATTAGTVAAAKAPSLWSKVAGSLLSTAVPAATNLIGTKMQVDANKAAADATAQATQEALDWQKSVYADRQRQFAPYIGVGGAAQVRLGELMGIPTPQGGYQPQAPNPAAPAPAATPPAATTPPPAAAPPAAQTPPPVVTMLTPDGRRVSVPAAQVEEALTHGMTKAA